MYGVSRARYVSKIYLNLGVSLSDLARVRARLKRAARLFCYQRMGTYV